MNLDFIPTPNESPINKTTECFDNSYENTKFAIVASSIFLSKYGAFVIDLFSGTKSLIEYDLQSKHNKKEIQKIFLIRSLNSKVKNN